MDARNARRTSANRQQNTLPSAKTLYKKPMRLLPGNVIVHLNPAWNQGTIQNWLNAKKLVAVEQLEFGPNIFLIKTGAGLEALETANRIYESGEVVAAYPNWWVEMHKK